MVLAIVTGTLACAGCVERKITIGSEPSGALVKLNDVDVGRTPVTVPFTWYGDYDLVLRYEKNVGTPDSPVMKHYYLHTDKKADAPVWQIVPLDLFAEILPIPFEDHKVWAFEIPPVPELTDEQLLNRAAELKGRLGEPEELQKKKQ